MPSSACKRDYTIEGLRQNVPLSLAQVTILGNYNRTLRLMELYRNNVAYGSDTWKKSTSHQKVYSEIILPGGQYCAEGPGNCGSNYVIYCGDSLFTYQ